MRKKRKHLLIVGGTGFIGYHLAAHVINNGWDVSSISISPPKKHMRVKKVKYILLDITKFKDIKKKIKYSFTHVVNLCGYNSYLNSKKENHKIFLVNFVGLFNLANFFLNKNIIKFVQIGSSAEYGNIMTPHDENKDCLPNSIYGLSKLKSTNYLIEMFNLKKFPVTILRLF